MMVYDIIMLIVLGAAIAWGIYKGLAWQVASFASIIASYLVSYQFSGVLAAQIKAEAPWNKYLAMLILYLGTSLIIWIAFRLVKETIDKVKLKEFDQHVGGVLGFAKGVVLCVIITLFGVTLLGESEQKHIVNSHSGYYIAVLLDKSHAVLPAEMNNHVHALIHKLDESLPDDYERFHDHEHDHGSFPTQPTMPVGGGGFNWGVDNNNTGGTNENYNSGNYNNGNYAPPTYPSGNYVPNTNSYPANTYPNSNGQPNTANQPTGTYRY